MKKILLAFIASLVIPAAAHALPLTYVHVATWTLGGTGTKAFAFQNTSSDIDVRILSVELGTANGATVTSGPAQFWLLMSTAVTHGGTTQVSFYDLSDANATAPSYVSVSTGPINVAVEGKQTRQLPIARPLIVNPDETAAANFADSLDFNAPSDARELLLPHGDNRALVIEQRQFGPTDYTAGVVSARIVYTVR